MTSTCDHVTDVNTKSDSDDVRPIVTEKTPLLGSEGGQYWVDPGPSPIVTEKTPLLGSEGGQYGIDPRPRSPGSETKSTSGTRKVIPRRTVIVEPVLVMYVICVYPMTLASQLYVYDKFLASMAANEGINVTSAPGESPGCEVNQSDITEFLDRVQSNTSQFYSLLGVATGIPAFFVSLFLGPYSDKAGRKWGLIPPLVGASFKAAFYVLVVVLDLDVLWLIIGALFDGFGGFLTTLVSACSAYLADVTTAEKRIMRLTIIEMCSLASLVLTPLGLGYLIEQTGYTYAFVAVLGGFLICLMYVIFFVPETIQKDPNESARFCTTDNIKKTLELYTVDNGRGRRWKMNILTCVFLCGTLVRLNVGVDTLFVKNRPLCWDSVLLGIFTAVNAGVSAGGAVVTAKTLKCCVSDNVIAMVAVLGGIVLCVYKTFVTSTIMMFFASAFGPFGYLILPSLRAILSNLVSESEQGRLFGAIASVEVVGLVVGAVTFNLIYSKTLYIRAGFVFLTMAMVLVIAAILFAIYLCRISRESKKLTTDVLSESVVTALGDKPVLKT